MSSNSSFGISLLTTGLIASGGENIESVESIKRYAPRIYASQNRALTANDYETLIPAKIYPETESISVFGGEELIPPQYGKVFISIKPRTGDFLPNLIKENCIAFINVIPEEFNLKQYVDYDTMFEKSFLEPLTTILNGVGWSAKPQATLEGLFA